VESQIVRSSTFMSSNGFAMMLPPNYGFGNMLVYMSKIDHERQNQSCCADLMSKVSLPARTGAKILK